ncbi:MAG: hypothetical protein F4X65_09355 [Chloroflexi bacterium]|nr:hypothetical protein [Chloroflexota bacterium]
MASQTSASGHPPSLSSCLTAAQEWLHEDYAASIVWQVLDAREQLPAEIKRALDAAIRSSSVKVPGAAFQLQDVQDAPTHHLHTPVFRKMQVSDELTEAVLRAWVAIQGQLYESVVQHLQWNDEPTYGPDRQERTFRGYWDVRDWQTNFNQFLADRTGFDQNDVGLMLWYVSGKLPPPIAEVEDPSDRVDFERWRELLLALSPDAPQWENALLFADAISEIVDEKERQRARNAVNQLKTKLEDIWLEYSDELIYLEKNIGLWGSRSKIQPEVALQTLAEVNNLESLLSQYRPIRDQAQSRSVETTRAGRRAELEAEIISTVNELEPILAPSGEAEFLDLPVMDSIKSLEDVEPADTVESVGAADSIDAFAPVVPVENETLQPVEEGDFLPASFEESEIEAAFEELLDIEVTGCDEEDVLPEVQLPSLDPYQGPASEVDEDGGVNASILAGLQSLQQDLEQLRAQLVTPADERAEGGTNSAGKAGQVEEDGALPAIDGMAAVVKEAEERFPRQLMFRLSAESWVLGNPYEDSQAVLDALAWLATTYVAARSGDMDLAAMSDSLYRACRWKYSNNQHDGIFFQNEGRYRMLVNGKAYSLNETIGRGSGDDPVNAIRIAFYWDRQRERVVIGYIGQPQLTGKG